MALNLIQYDVTDVISSLVLIQVLKSAQVGQQRVVFFSRLVIAVVVVVFLLISLPYSPTIPTWLSSL